MVNRQLNVAVIGAALMGHAIAQVFASAGHQTTLTDSDDETLASAPAHIEHNLNQMGIEAAPVLSHLRLNDSLVDAVKDAAIVIEAVPERLDLKQRLFAIVAEAAPATAVLASNTSVIPITDIGAQLPPSARARVLGTHWWNPPHLVPLVEVIRTPFTAPEVFDDTFDLLERVGKRPVKAQRDITGFIGNRLQHALWREAFFLVQSGVCDAQTIDTVVKQSFGLRSPVLGPMENADLVGLELVQAIHDLIFPTLDCATTASPLLAGCIEAGHTGMKQGEGLRKWTPEQAERVRSTLALHLISATRTA
ncbi:3-hydroxyacyl-CoA dehydrogenase family protein [Paraburkholderia sp.]|uniref:3-hydroxyacyl-CoA dehydrogenase family protein n=1 Tax=Paraburkholderia sp. TaxID=1926495 RepID=UPI002F409967